MSSCVLGVCPKGWVGESTAHRADALILCAPVQAQSALSHLADVPNINIMYAHFFF